MMCLPLMYQSIARERGMVELRKPSIDDRITFNRASDRSYKLLGGLDYATTDEWPLEFDPATGICLGRGVWAAATNLFQRSEEADNAYWTKANASVTADAAAFIDGNTTMDALVEASDTGQQHLFRRSVSFTTGTAYTGSTFAKADTRGWIRLQFPSAAFGSAIGCYFDLSTGAVGTADSGVVGHVEDWGGGIYRCCITATATASAAGNFTYALAAGDGQVVYNGDGTSRAFFGGMQLETGSIATPYIPTTSATVTRSADSAIITDLSSIGFNASEGTIIVRGRSSAKPVGAAGSDIIAEFNDGTANERVLLFRNGTTQVARMTVADGGVNQAAFTISGKTIAASERICFAAAWAANDFAASINGGSVSTDLAGSLPTVDRMAIGGAGFSSSSQWQGYIEHILYIPRRITNAELAIASQV